MRRAGSSGWGSGQGLLQRTQPIHIHGTRWVLSKVVREPADVLASLPSHLWPSWMAIGELLVTGIKLVCLLLWSSVPAVRTLSVLIILADGVHEESAGCELAGEGLSAHRSSGAEGQSRGQRGPSVGWGQPRAAPPCAGHAINTRVHSSCTCPSTWLQWGH